jgi:predicted phage replisome organizer
MDERYYWLKFDEHFFDEDNMIYLEALENGEKYIIFWQKLLLKCLKNRHTEDKNYGFIRFSEKIPYNDELLAKMTRTNIDTVRVAIKYFQELEMINILDDGTIYIEEVNKLIGSESKSAERVRKHREKINALQCNKTNVTSNNNKRKEKKNKINNNDIEEIYKKYPTKCPIKSSNTGKSSNNKDKIKTLLKAGNTKDELIETIDLYVKDCKKTDTYIKNFGTFLNNLPDIESLKANTVSDNTEPTEYVYKETKAEPMVFD